ncbi:MAG: zinc-dependent alcohol dehydrogenase family protein [Polymorphobacter sp.]|uniref:zinc-dependent alcohol dehydrogenase family protein n=1 Tax=Polymorphobacter sp. TaxID=1909290 RepID=UPI003A889360
MKAYQIGPQTGLDSLTPVERPAPKPGPGEVLLDVLSVCLNHRDMDVLKGRYGPKRDQNRIPVSEGVGRVAALGDGVTGLAVGDRVVGPHFVTWIDGDFSPAAFGHDVGITHDGWLAEQVVMPAAALIRVPDGVSNDQAAPLASSALTAWHAVVEVGKVKAGDLVLTLGTGGVSIFALQIAKMHGARVAITSSSDDKLALARKLGADITINYKVQSDWAAALAAETGGRGADIILETGGQSTLPMSVTAAAPNARLVIIGFLAGFESAGLPNYGSIIGKNLTLRGIAEGSRAMLARLLAAIDANGLQPVIDKRFSFDEAPHAYRYLESGAHVGKVVIDIARP